MNNNFKVCQADSPYRLVAIAALLAAITACGGGSGGGTTNKAPAASGITITDGNGGSAEIGDMLTGDYNYTDAEGDAEGPTSFRWMRGGVPIPGATTPMYTPVAADAGQAISFEVTPAAATGTSPGTAALAETDIMINAAPLASAVSITDVNGGNAVTGDALTGNYTYSDADFDAEGTSILRWLRDNVAIAGAVTSTYTLLADDVDHAITFAVTPVALTGTSPGDTQISASIDAVNAAPLATAVHISDDNDGNVEIG
ncbi:MAG: hypothetical protein WBO06_03210, partial [Gammaproteobacteria bacterium]